MKRAFIFVSCTVLHHGAMATSEHRRQLSHILRRLQFAPRPGQIAELEELSIDKAVQQIIDSDTPVLLEGEPLRNLEARIEDGDWDDLALWYLGRVTAADSGFHERMVWFWHTHLTSSSEETRDRLMVRQHALFRTHALGNFRDLLKAVTIDGAMLNWLDGDQSRGEAPNENYAREMMELFALGPGAYTEDDIRIAARALSGWQVDYETSDVRFDPGDHYSRPMRFMGERRTWDVESIVDKVCDQPECARHVASSLFQFLIGTEPTEAELDELATEFRASNLDILTLVQAIVALPTFTAGNPARARNAVEWLVATMAVFGPEAAEPEYWWLDHLAQVPFQPPNVGGWAKDDRWVGASQQLIRTSILLEFELSDAIVRDVEPTPDAVLAHCGIFDATDTTRNAMTAAIEAQTEFNHGLELLFVLALTSPEFAHI